ncbi:MAG: cytochrome c maturation protein CcmE [candidate division Zixibacteria bacterium]|nr:cytochrome c maturation protein CcmE [candidate division Zixibacteria bacterium]
MKAKYIIGALIIVVFVVWGTSAFLTTTVQYVPIEQAAVASRTVQVMGKIDFDKVKYDTDKSCLEFAIYDAEAATPQAAQSHLQVVYYGVVPGNFDQATSVVLKGKSGADGTFIAEQMLVKCPSKYQGEGGEYQDMKKHDEAVGASTGA